MIKRRIAAPLALLLSTAALACAWLAPAETGRAATIEFLSGAKVECTVLSKTETEVTVEAVISGKKFTKVYPLSTIHVVTINDKRYVINEKSAAATPAPRPASDPATSPPAGGAAKAPAAVDPSAGGTDTVTRTKAQVDALIDQVGRTPPDWFDSTPLNYPRTLDLTFPAKPPGGWNNQVNVGQYMWDVVNPNPGKWREGVRLLHHMLTLNNDSDTQVRIMKTLASKYHNLLQDYARAAFWWRKAGVEANPSSSLADAVHLAECYWRLGNRKMAEDLLARMPNNVTMIKLVADMGYTDRALQLSQAYVSGYAHIAYMLAGDACRLAGRYPQAIQYYQQVLNVPATGQYKGRIEREHTRARESIDAIKYFELSDVKRVADGSYTAQSEGYEGPVQVAVDVRAGRIESVRVTQHREKQFYSAIDDTPAKIIAKQGVKGVDTTASATVTSEAIVNATAKALASGAK
jgi:uncharacterized protein with FMN-binding domain